MGTEWGRGDVMVLAAPAQLCVSAVGGLRVEE